MQKNNRPSSKYMIVFVVMLVMLAFPVLKSMASEVDNTDIVEQKSEQDIKQDIKEVKAIDYNTVLSFPITKEKLIAFVKAADKIDQVNRKWDMLISGAESDTMAVEYIGQSSEEMQAVMGSVSGITIDEYNEIFEYATKNDDFNAIITAFKQYYVVAPRLTKNKTVNVTDNQDSSAESEAN